MDTLFRISRDIPGVEAETLFQIFGLPVRNSLILSVVITILLVAAAAWVVKTFRVNPGRGQAAVEIVYEGVKGLVSQITSSAEHTKKILPLIGTIFVYLGVSNVIAAVPGLTSIEYGGVALFRTPTTDFSVTFGLALALILLIQVISIRDWGLFGYLGRFFQFRQVYEGFKKGIGAGMQSIIEFLIGLLDIVSEISRVISLSLRLFGNIYAGEVIAMIFLGGLAYVLPAVWLSANIFFSLIQAVVFSGLVTAYYMISLKPKEEESKKVVADI